MRKFTLLFAALIFTVTVICFTACLNSPLKLVQSKSTLSVEAAIIYKMGGVQPVARTKFYLLNRSAEEILKSANLKPQPEELARYRKVAEKARIDFDQFGYLQLLGFALQFADRNTAYLSDVTLKINAHIVKSEMTDLQGKTQFEEIEPGKYYIFGTAETRNGAAIWDLPIEIKDEKQSVILDQNNAAAAL